MDWISQLHDVLLLQILSLLPTKDVLATSLFSKRWLSLWMLVPKLKYDDSHMTESWRFSRFVDRSLLLHKAPVLESLHFKLSSRFRAVDIGIWIKVAVERGLQELHIVYPSDWDCIRFSGNLYACETLMVLKLENAILVDVPFLVNLHSLKILHLRYVKYSGDKSLSKLLSNCPNLEELDVKRFHSDGVTTFSIVVPSLRRLFLCNIMPPNPREGHHTDFAINAPSLNCLYISGNWSSFNLIENLPELAVAKIILIHFQNEKLLRSLKTVQCLTLCSLASKVSYPTDVIFSRLVDLEIYTSVSEWWNLLTHMIESSPKLRVLRLTWKHPCLAPISMAPWNSPCSVPECFLFHLETLLWRRFIGTQREKEVIAYILRNARRLKTATISLETTNSGEKRQILKELASLDRGSTECRLVFDCPVELF